MIKRMQRRERGQPVELDELSPSGPDRRFREGKALVTSSMPELE
jgi:hypothetical protein